MGQYLEMADCEPAHTASHKAWITTRHVVTLSLSVSVRPVLLECLCTDSRYTSLDRSP